ncbi:hypothetical protein PF011_g21489 [Phytophthora fragariae]|uniref:Uncharacterized protein n=1 Tax=Phytophthora fragariae TaxID=53985 RepID=A0A6A3IPQ6_9STRA|nr:hypothetical protein PF011_g21489 [Phytophthora fragariae]
MKDANANDGDDDDEEEDEELEDKPAPPAQVDNSTSATPAASSSSRGGTKRVRQSSPQSSSKKARKTSTAAKSKSSSVKPASSKSVSSKPAAHKSASSKSAAHKPASSKSAATKSTLSKSTAHKPASSKSTVAKTAKSGSASSGQSAGSSAGSDLPDELALPLATPRTRAAQAVARESRVPAQMKIWRNPPFFHLGSARCWDKILASCSVAIEMETVHGKSCAKPTPSSPEGLAAFLDVTSTQHPCLRLRTKLPELGFFMSPEVLHRVESRRSSPKTAPPVEIVDECWLKCRGERPGLMKIFIALYECMHWVVDSSVILGLHPDLNPGRTPAELALALKLWQQ